MATSRKSKNKASEPVETGTYTHPEAKSLLRPEVGTQAQFKKKKPPATYRYDSSLAPALEWDGTNWAREAGAWLIAKIEEASQLPAPHRFAQVQELKDARGRTALRVSSLAEAVTELKRLEKPFLNWAGKAERLSFEVPTLPLFVHERLLAGTVSAPFKSGGHGQVAVKVLDDRGNELLVVKSVQEVAG